MNLIYSFQFMFFSFVFLAPLQERMFWSIFFLISLDSFEMQIVMVECEFECYTCYRWMCHSWFLCLFLITNKRDICCQVTIWSVICSIFKHNSFVILQSSRWSLYVQVISFFLLLLWAYKMFTTKWLNSFVSFIYAIYL